MEVILEPDKILAMLNVIALIGIVYVVFYKWGKERKDYGYKIDGLCSHIESGALTNARHWERMAEVRISNDALTKNVTNLVENVHDLVQVLDSSTDNNEHV